MRREMDTRRIGRPEQVEWFKWLRYYLDFRLKYQHSTRDPDTEMLSLQKLHHGRVYKGWTGQFQEFLKSKPVAEVDADDAVRFPTWLATYRLVVSTTQNQAFNALLFFL